MKTILAINGSASPESANLQLLKAIAEQFRDYYRVEIVDGLWELPLFNPELQRSGVPNSISELKGKISRADSIIITTPEYLHNIPAVLKSMLEWLTESGELAQKPILAITFAPVQPRGQFAMISLLHSLKASKANVVAELSLYQNDLRSTTGTIVLDQEHILILNEALSLL